MNAPRYDYAQIAAELIRAVRGKRSQTALSRRLGYKTNVVYIWEAQKGAPTASGFFRLLHRLKLEPEERLVAFYRERPDWLNRVELCSVEGPAALLNDLKGKRTLVETASAMSASRYALARWLSGEAEPRLPDFLEAIEVTSLRLLDFIAAFVDPALLPCMRAAWHRLQEARRAAYEMPWSHAVLRVLELETYKKLKAHKPGWIANQLGLSPAIEQEALQLLQRTGQIEEIGGKWQIVDTLTIDTRRDPGAAAQLKAWWFGIGKQRFEQGAPGVFSYNLFGVSHKDLARIQDLQRAHFREIRRIVAESQPVQTVAVVNLQIFSLLFDATPSESTARDTVPAPLAP
jgi:hypothetical protein